MLSSVASSRGLLIPTLVVLSSGLVGCDKAKGVAAVEDLCAKDGGEHIYATAYAHGYLTDSRSYFCSSCIELLGNRKFEYIDARITGPGERDGKYFRYSLGAKGDADCEEWRDPQAERLLMQLGIREGQCIVVTALPDMPKGYVYVRKGMRISVDAAIKVVLDEWRLSEIDSGTVVARIRDYQFTSKMSSMLDMSGHGGNPDATCMSADEKARSVTTLPERVLRDPMRK